MTGRPSTPGPLGNFAALGSSEIAARIAGFFATALLARTLGVENFGMLGFATAVMAYFGIAMTAGFGDIGAREVARNPARANQLAVDATLVRLLLALGGIAATGVIAFAFVSSPVQRIVLLVSALTLFSVALDTTWVYRGLSRSGTAGAALLMAQLAYLAGVVLLVHAPSDVVRVPAIQFAGELVAALFLFMVLLRGRIPSPRIAGGIGLLRESGFITVSRLLRAIIVTFDVLLLAAISGSHDVGLYTAAYRVCMLVTTIAVATHIVFLPRVATAAREGPASLSKVMSHSIALTSTVVLPLALGGVVVAEPLLILLFGGEYAGATTAFQVLLISMAVLALHGTGHYVFVSLHRTRREAVIFGAAAGLNVILNFILIPRFGLNGAAVATLMAESLILVVSVIALRSIGLSPPIWGMLRPLVASLAMAGLLLLVSGRLPVLVLIPLGGIVYSVILAATGGLKPVLADAGSGR